MREWLVVLASILAQNVLEDFGSFHEVRYKFSVIAILPEENPHFGAGLGAGPLLNGVEESGRRLDAFRRHHVPKVFHLGSKQVIFSGFEFQTRFTVPGQDLLQRHQVGFECGSMDEDIVQEDQLHG